MSRSATDSYTTIHNTIVGNKSEKNKLGNVEYIDSMKNIVEGIVPELIRKESLIECRTLSDDEKNTIKDLILEYSLKYSKDDSILPSPIQCFDYSVNTDDPDNPYSYISNFISDHNDLYALYNNWICSAFQGKSYDIDYKIDSSPDSIVAFLQNITRTFVDMSMFSKDLAVIKTNHGSDYTIPYTDKRDVFSLYNRYSNTSKENKSLRNIYPSSVQTYKFIYPTSTFSSGEIPKRFKVALPEGFYNIKEGSTDKENFVEFETVKMNDKFCSLYSGVDHRRLDYWLQFVNIIDIITIRKKDGNPIDKVDIQMELSMTSEDKFGKNEGSYSKYTFEPICNLVNSGIVGNQFICKNTVSSSDKTILILSSINPDNSCTIKLAHVVFSPSNSRRLIRLDKFGIIGDNSEYMVEFNTQPSVTTAFRITYRPFILEYTSETLNDKYCEISPIFILTNDIKDLKRLSKPNIEYREPNGDISTTCKPLDELWDAINNNRCIYLNKGDIL